MLVIMSALITPTSSSVIRTYIGDIDFELQVSYPGALQKHQIHTCKDFNGIWGELKWPERPLSLSRAPACYIFVLLGQHGVWKTLCTAC